jgi:GWxTD domain-containing protein
MFGSRKITVNLFVCSLLVWRSSLLFAQPMQTWELPIRSTGALVFDVDVYQFEGKAGHTRVEICYAFHLKKDARRDTLAIDIHLELQNKAQKLVDGYERKSFSFADAPGDSLLRFVDLKKYELPPDTVYLRLTLVDSLARRRGEAEACFVVRDFLREPSLSDLIFVSSIHRAGKGSDGNFFRNGLLMLPNPSRIFVSDSTAIAWFYFEINRLHYDASQPSTYSLRYDVTDLSNQVVFSQERLGLPVTAINSSRVEKIPLRSFKPSLYHLTVHLTEGKSATTVRTERYFQVYGNDEKGMSAFVLDEKNAQSIFEQIKYIATKAEKELYKKLDNAGKAEFIVHFWQVRDPSPDTPENEMMVEHFRRLAYAEQVFKGGLNADMARIYIQYGPPLDLDRMASNNQYNKPVEIWTYGINGNTEFVFVDRNGDGHYVLVHSNHPDEFANPEWERDVNNEHEW